MLDIIFIIIFVKVSRSGSASFKKLQDDRIKAYNYIDSIPNFKSTQKDIGIIEGKFDRELFNDNEKAEIIGY